VVNTLPSAKKRKELRSLAAKPDREVDFSDIPKIREIPPDAVVGKFYRPKKASAATQDRHRVDYRR
jgi:hypothetical protein